MPCRLGVTYNKKTRDSWSLRRLGSCFYFRVSRLGPAAVLAALLTCVVSASPFVGGASFYSDLYQPSLGEQQFFAPGTYSFGGASATLSGLSGGSLVAEASGAPGYSHDSIAYTFAVVGPDNGLVVPLWITFALSVSAIGTEQGLPTSGAYAYLALASNSGESSVFQVGAGEEPIVTPNPTLSATVPFTLTSNQLGFVSELVKAENGKGAAKAFVDPYIFIDPGFLSAHPGYSVIVSNGIDNTPLGVAGVPEPATLGLVGLCLAGIAGMGVRRRAAGELRSR